MVETAAKGGEWAIDWGRSNFSTANSKGVIAMKGARSSSSVHSQVINSTSTESQVDLSLDGLATGNGAYISYIGRQTEAGRYQADFRVAADGAVTMTVTKNSGGTDTVIGTANVGTYTAGQPLHLRFALDGAESTAVRARAPRERGTRGDGVERGLGRLKHDRGPTTGYDRLAVRYRTTTRITAIDH